VDSRYGFGWDSVLGYGHCRVAFRRRRRRQYRRRHHVHSHASCSVAVADCSAGKKLSRNECSYLLHYVGNCSWLKSVSKCVICPWLCCADIAASVIVVDVAGCSSGCIQGVEQLSDLRDVFTGFFSTVAD